MKKFFTFAYLLRAPLALWVILAVLVPGAITVPLFRGMLVFEGWREVFFTSFIVFLAAASMMITTNLVLLYGERRLYGGKDSQPVPIQNDRRTTLVFLICLAPAVFFVLRAASYTMEQGRFVKDPKPMSALAVYTLTVAGFLAAAAAVIAAKVLQMWFSKAFPGTKTGLYLVIPVRWIPVLGTRIDRLYTRPSPLAAVPALAKILSIIMWPIRTLMRFAGEGYCDYEAGEMRPLPGHAFGAWLAFLTLLAYWVSGATHKEEYATSASMQPTAWFPTIFHVLIALLLAIWLLSALTFFFDRYRIPVVSLIAVGIVFSLFVGNTDHVFDLGAGQATAYLTPNQVLRLDRTGERTASGRRIIVVSAAGGGIQAAAWTAKVLGELAPTPGFPQSVRAISCVSGGSVGALHYLTTYPGVAEKQLSPGVAMKNATEDSLEGIAWGLVHPDFWRTLFPWADSANIDRGWALERILAKRSGTNSLRLSKLAASISQGVPAMLINSTAVESGAPMVFASTEFPEPGVAAGIDSFRHRYGNADIDVAKAVRLSATFPFVSPAARASDRNVPPFHFVDGGYYDNYGMAALIAWLRAGLMEPPKTQAAPSQQPERLDPELASTQILILQINSFPPAGDPHPKPMTWLFQFTAPILALYDAREHSQQVRDEFEYQLQRQAKLFSNVSTVQFQFNPGPASREIGCGGSPPLSWHLTRGEIRCIDEAWSNPSQRNSQACVNDFLNGTWDEALSRTCQETAKAKEQPTSRDPVGSK